MCGGVRYKEPEPSLKEWSIYFPNPKAAMPVALQDGSIEWIKWGKRREESAPGFIQGGWARRLSIEEGKWDRFHPEFVALAVQKFMEKDAAKVSHWFDIETGMAIQGLIAHANGEQRLYVVTVPTPSEFAWVEHDRWPALVTAA